MLKALINEWISVSLAKISFKKSSKILSVERLSSERQTEKEGKEGKDQWEREGGAEHDDDDDVCV